MMDFIIYDAKAAVVLAVFYMFYRLLLSKETFHRLNRVVLLTTAVGSLLLPLWQITLHRTVEVDAQPALQVSEITQPIVQAALPTTPWWHTALTTLFIIGAIAVLLQTLFSVYRVVKIVSSGEQKLLSDGIKLVVTQEEVSPFSWMRTIVLSQSDYETDHAAILSHERAHIRLHHSWDLLLVDLVSSLQWFNPAIWMLRSDLCAVHEYEADAQVLNEGYNAKQYQYLLVKKAVGMSGYSVANSFNHRELKSRITMMCRKKSSRGRVLRALYLLPLVGACLALNARTQVDYVEKLASSSDKVTMNSPILQESEEISSPIDTLKKEKNKIAVVVTDTLTEVPAGVHTNDNDDGKVKIKIVRDGSVKVVDPLVIVNGVRIEDINTIDPNSIKSFQVLKDEDAIKLYGDEAKNGVIVISTKDRAKDQLRYTVDDVEVSKEIFDKAFAAGYAEVGRRTDKETGVATAYIYSVGSDKVKKPATKTYLYDAEGNELLHGDDDYSWRNGETYVVENLATGERTETKIVGYEIDGKQVTKEELKAFKQEGATAFRVTDEGILSVMTREYISQQAAQRRANENK
ncbi:MAG: TonB-dependent receptor plug domain-containing protein [Bacteroidaceae bacterium]|nr:TonB-dependent receptor plug domain-containing protein [Bacteroidaceae bacterium]